MYPDFVPPKKELNYYRDIQNNTIGQPKVEQDIPVVDINDVRTLLATYGKTFSGKTKDIYELAKLTTRTTKNKKDSVHYFHLFIVFYIQSLLTVYPEKKDEFLDIKDKLEILKKEVDKIIKTCDYKDNTEFIPAIYGITETLI